MKLIINILIALWMFWMGVFYVSMTLKLLAVITGIEALASNQLRGVAAVGSIGLLVFFVKQTKTGRVAVIIMLALTIYFVSSLLINLLLTHFSPAGNDPYPPRAYISLPTLLLVNTLLLLWQMKQFIANKEQKPTKSLRSG